MVLHRSSLIMKRSFLLVVIWGTALFSNARAQYWYAGGDGDGFTADTTVFNYIDLPFIGSGLFTGGDGDGFTADTTVFNYIDLPFIASGLFTGGSGDGFAIDSTEWESGIPTLLVDARVYLEGPFSNDSLVLVPAFATAVPNVQPYGADEFSGTPLYYPGADSFAVKPDSAVDWVRVSLRSAPGANSAVGLPRAALVTTNGWIRDTDGTSKVEFGNVDPGGYYLVVDHRSHASVMSSDTLDLSDALGTWDFTDSLEAAYTSGPAPMKNLPGGKLGMFACDISHDGQITATDFNSWLVDTKAAATGYLSTDCNMDAQVTVSDFNLWLANTNAAAASRVPR